MTYRVKKNHCYHVPCYQHQPVAKRDNEPVELCGDVDSAFPAQSQSDSFETLAALREDVESSFPSQRQSVPILSSNPDMPEQESVEDQNKLENLLVDNQQHPEEQVVGTEAPEPSSVMQPAHDEVSSATQPTRKSNRKAPRPRYLKDYEC